jgi:hypothetical protein
MWKPGRSTLPLFALLCSPVLLGGQQQTVSPPAAGLWHLLAADQAEQPLPEHRADFRLQLSPAPFKAVMVNRVTGEDMPLAAATFDGKILRLQMKTSGETAQADMPWLQMTWNGTRFDGGWVDKDGKPPASAPGLPPMKLIRGKQ